MIDKFLGEPVSFWAEIKHRVEVLDNPAIVKILLMELAKASHDQLILREQIAIIREASVQMEMSAEHRMQTRIIRSAMLVVDKLGK